VVAAGANSAASSNAAHAIEAFAMPEMITNASLTEAELRTP
jgi:hypothetical protein